MAPSLKVSIGQSSDRGRKEVNQDFYGLIVPEEPLLSSKGIAVAIADGISSSNVSGIAAESAVKSFLSDYYCTSETWSVKTAAQRVLTAANSWLYAETRRSIYAYERDKGYVCTFSALVLKAEMAHLFHVGDARIYRLSNGNLEQLTEDHRLVAPEQSYLTRALGSDRNVEIDYRALRLSEDDCFVLVTDGIYEHVGRRDLVEAIETEAAELDKAARLIVAAALRNGSSDNLTVQIVRVDRLSSTPAGGPDDVTDLPPAPLLDARAVFEGFRIVRKLHGSSRSHIYLAVDEQTGQRVALKVPSIDLRENVDYLRRFCAEEWIARRLDSPHVLKPFPVKRQRRSLYVALEYVEGTTLTQWMRDHPTPDLESVRKIVEQVAQGLRVFHRKEMVHQDLRPDNVMVDVNGTAKIIDFGSTQVAGLDEINARSSDEVLGTEQYSAPEYLLGEGATDISDLYSLGVIAYQMLSGRLPYGTSIARTKAQQRKLVYRSVLHDDREIPAWVDGALRRAVNPDPLKRYQAVSEFLYDLRHPNAIYLNATRGPLLERNPLLFWRSVSLALLAVVFVLAVVIAKR